MFSTFLVLLEEKLYLGFMCWKRDICLNTLVKLSFKRIKIYKTGMCDICMIKNDELKVAMVTAVSEVLKIKKVKKDLSHEEMMRELERFISKTKEKNSRLMMIVTASKTLDVINRNPRLNDREIMKKMVKDFDFLIENAEEID